MRRLGRHAFTALSALSLLLCVAVCVLWVRSYWRNDWIAMPHSGDERRLVTARGWLVMDNNPALERAMGRYSTVMARERVRFEEWQRQTDAFTWWAERAFDAHRTGQPFPELPPASGAPHESAALPQLPTYEAQRLAPLPALAVVTGLLSVSCLHRAAIWHRRRRRARLRVCPTCGYDLRASPGRCPECGASGVIPTPIPTAGEIEEKAPKTGAKR